MSDQVCLPSVRFIYWAFIYGLLPALLLVHNYTDEGKEVVNTEF